MIQVFCFPQAEHEKRVSSRKFIIFLLKITLEVTCVLVAVLSIYARLSSSREKEINAIVGEIGRLRHDQGHPKKLVDETPSQKTLRAPIIWNMHDVIGEAFSSPRLPFSPTQLQLPSVDVFRRKTQSRTWNEARQAKKDWIKEKSSKREPRLARLSEHILAKEKYAEMSELGWQ